MSRKPKSDSSTPTETPNTPAETPAADSAATLAAPTAGSIPQAGFADKVGQKKYPPVADPYGIATDNVAGVRLLESRQDRQVALKFGDGGPESKPSQAVIDKVKEGGFRWDSRERVWTRPVRGNSAMSTRIEAETLYQDVCQMIREEKGIEGDGQGVPF